MMTSMLQEVDDMASVVIQEPPSSPSRMAVFVKKVQTIIRRCLPSRRRPQEHVPDRGARGVKRGAQRYPRRGAGGGRPPAPRASERPEHVDSGHIEVERGERSGNGQPPSLPSGSETSQTPLPPDLGFASFQAPHSTSYRFLGFRAPPPPGTAGSSTSHQPIWQASSSDEEERADDMDGVQRYEFRHCVGKKTTRFTPSDWP
ncbi:hypothetical protein M9H77_11814 [Catharanthus roseus]|uniref:Uncharacterized protein n=1 Tax=Catharanthus roseus TaxID=4058 RepID=A0ACC0BFK9_CATRO|nr:hypothetical protein M9H77_11814 [Catharanthus roseus]